MSLRSTVLGWRSYVGAAVLAAALVASVVALWMLLPLANTFHSNAGHDFRILYAAALALRMHQNPYDPAVLLPHIIAAGLARHFVVDARGVLIQPYVYPPIFAWSVIPLTHLSPARALLLWRVFSVVCVFTGTLGLTATWNSTSGLRPFGNRLHQALLAALVACSPLAAYAYYWGNPVVLVYVAMGGWCWLVTRRRTSTDALAGVVMIFALLKPQLALPLAILAAFCLVRGPGSLLRRGRVALAFGVTCAGLLGLNLVLTGPALLRDWPRSINYLSGMIYMQPDMPSLIGLLRPTLLTHSPRVQSAALYGVMLLGGVVVIWLYRALRTSWTPMAVLALTTVIWCFSTPYAHANDELLMVPGGLALIAALISMTQLLAKSPRTKGRWARLGIVARGSLQVAVSALALWALWRGGVLDFDSFRSPPIPRPTLVPLGLLLGFVAAWSSFGKQAHEAMAEAPVPRSGRGMPLRMPLRRLDAGGLQGLPHSTQAPQ